MADQWSSTADHAPADASGGWASTADHAAEGSAAPRSVSGFASNALRSAGHLAGGLVTAIVHPIDTVHGLADVAAGAFNDLTGDSKTDTGAAAESDQKYRAFAADLKSRYGTLGAIGKTLYEDPVGVLADLSTIAGGAAGAAGRVAEVADASKLGNLANGARTAAKAAETASKVTNPVYLATQPVAATLDLGLNHTAQRLYQSALKPPKSNSLENIDSMLKTGIDNGLIPGSADSFAKLKKLLTDVRSEIDAGINARPGATADPADIAARVDQMRDRFQTVNPKSDLQDIDRAKREFLDQFAQPAPQSSGLLGPNGQPIPAPAAAPPRQMTLRELQDMKTKTNATLDGKYGSQSQAGIEAQKALVRGLKEEAEGLFPELRDLNQQQGALMNLEPALEAALKRTGSKDLIPIGDGVTSTAKKIFDSPQLKARIAIALERTPAFGPSTGMKVGQRLALVDARVKNYLDGIAAAAAQQPPIAPAP